MLLQRNVTTSISKLGKKKIVVQGSNLSCIYDMIYLLHFVNNLFECVYIKMYLIIHVF